LGVVSGTAGEVSGAAGDVSGTVGVTSGVVAGGSGIGSRNVLGRSDGELGVSAGVGCISRPGNGCVHGMRIESAAPGIGRNVAPGIVHEL
jgi:hypothetical protein